MKEIKITLDEVLYLVKRDIDSKYDLLNDDYSIFARRDFITQVYYTYMREVKADNKLHLKFIDSALEGNLASWYYSTLSYNEKAPFEYRQNVVKFIEYLFKEVYEVEE